MRTTDPKSWRHILLSDKRGGGHAPRRGVDTKTEFRDDWVDYSEIEDLSKWLDTADPLDPRFARIHREVERIALSPDRIELTADRRAYHCYGDVDGVEVSVTIRPRKTSRGKPTGDWTIGTAHPVYGEGITVNYQGARLPVLTQDSADEIRRRIALDRKRQAK